MDIGTLHTFLGSIVEQNKNLIINTDILDELYSSINITDDITLGLLELHDRKLSTFLLEHCLKNNNMELTKYIIKNYGIYFEFIDIFEKNLDDPDMLKLLIDRGYIWHKNVLKCLFIKPNNIDMLLEHGVDLTKIIEHVPYFIQSNGGFNVNKTIIEILIDKIKNSKFNIDQELLTRFLVGCYNVYKLSLEQIKILVDLGANPNHSQDIMFIKSCGYGDIDVIKYFLYECGCDINTQKSLALIRAILVKKYDVVTFLLESGISIPDLALVKSLIDQDCLKIFLNNGVCAHRIAKILWNEFKNSCHKGINIDITVKELVKHGIDFNQIMSG